MSEVTDLHIDFSVDYQLLAREIVQQSRGSLSQRELSQKLNYSFNQVGKWESGATQIKWDDFILLCRSQSVPLEESFRNCFLTFSAEFNVATTLNALADAFSAGNPSANSFQHAFKKWGCGKSTPDLAEILRLLGTAPAVLIGWLSLFIDCEKISALSDSYKKLAVVINTLSERPNAAFVYAALQLEAYQSLSFHDESLLAEHSACTRPQLRSTLEHLLASGMIRFDGRKFHSPPLSMDISWLNHPKYKSVTQHATLHAARRFSANPNLRPPNLSNNVSYASERTACLSTQAVIEVSKRILRFHNEAEGIIIKDSHPKTNVQIILSHAYLPVASAYKPAPKEVKLAVDHESSALRNLIAITHEPEAKIDFALTARQILQVMRGELSQRQLSDKLGYTFNQVGKWESGATQFKWNDFLRVCKTLGVSIETSFWHDCLTPESELTPLSMLKTLSHHFAAGTSLDKRSHKVMEKWLSGKVVPDFAEVLKFMSNRMALMLTWLSEIVDCGKIASLHEANNYYRARSQAAFGAPDAMLVYSALCLNAYQERETHSEELLAELTKCSPTHTRQILYTLQLNGFIHFDGRKYLPLPYSEAHSRNWDAVCRSTQRAALRHSTEPSSFGSSSTSSSELASDFSVARSRVVALSAPGARLIRDLIWKYQSELGEIIRRDNLPKKHLVTVILHSYRSNTNAPDDPDSETH